MNITLIDCGDSVDDPARYSGWSTTSLYCNGERHVIRTTGNGVFTHDTARVEGPCPGGCTGKEVLLSPLVAAKFDLYETVPEGTVVVVGQRYHGQGERLPQNTFLFAEKGRIGAVLHEGEWIDVREESGSRSSWVRVTNRSGKPVISDEPERKRRRDYANAQRTKLEKAGAPVKKLFRSCGIGNAVHAWNWAVYAVDVLGRTQARQLVLGGGVAPLLADAKPVPGVLVGGKPYYADAVSKDAITAWRDGLKNAPFGRARKCAVLDDAGVSPPCGNARFVDACIEALGIAARHDVLQEAK